MPMLAYSQRTDDSFWPSGCSQRQSWPRTGKRHGRADFGPCEQRFPGRTIEIEAQEQVVGFV